MSYKRNDAKRLLTHYLRLVMEAAGERYDSDNEAEIESIVDCMIDAAKEELREEMAKQS